MKKESKRLGDKLKTILKLLLTALAIFLVFRKIDSDQLWEIVKTLNWIWLVPVLILFALSKVFTAFRLNRYFRTINLYISERLNLKLYLIGMFYNLFLPGGIGGDGYKVYLLNKQFKTPVKKLIQASLLDRLGGLVAIIFLLFWLFLLVEVQVEFLETTLWNGLMLIGIIVTIPLFWFLQKMFFTDFLPSFWSANAWSLAGQMTQIICALFILWSLGISENILAYQLVFLLSSIVAALPLTIGGVGARELVFIYAHTYVGIDEATAVAFSLIFFLISALVSLCGAFIKYKLPKAEN
ncbi:lysylphosphatidylglycerol synthase transmembrane domain-containing protein [Algoriphagus sp. SE2]|uniref:lysylphosphatidylglycerol synthase transmembrane domain-containing protein n=1 Tax=Algoriphagus sp. SE2 TaxID=3141536 RepID=UPI0031CD616C